jgi:hypothetical protein
MKPHDCEQWPSSDTRELLISRRSVELTNASFQMTSVRKDGVG